MKKIILFTILSLVLIISASKNSEATPITVTQNYTIDYNMFNLQHFTFSLILHGFSDDNIGQPDQTDTISLTAGPITGAEISLTHLSNEPNSWYLKSDTEMIGYLSPSEYYWVTDSWSLNQPILNSMMDTGLLSISFWNDSDEVKILAVDILSATVNGDNIVANPVPEPATMFLLGTGILGLSALRRKQAPAPIRNK